MFVPWGAESRGTGRNLVAATFAQGWPPCRPTTLLAQVDSSVGGKVGVNLPGTKNMVGAFLAARGMLIDTAVLATLPEREYRAGLAEVVKYGVILDADFSATWNRTSPSCRLARTKCCDTFGAELPAQGRCCAGRRAQRNGHSRGAQLRTYICHAFETLTGYGQILHGEGVAIGMTSPRAWPSD